MSILETETTYAWLDNNHSMDSLEVYVDGSFNYCAENANEEQAVFAAGWSINADEKLTGYGVNIFHASPTPSSSLSELRAMLSFLDMMHDHFPHLLDTRQITLICDNKGIVNLLTNTVLREDASRYSVETFGPDFQRMLYYMVTLNLSFKWVKGHADNDFNKIADMLARKAYRTMTAKNAWGMEDRRNWINEVMYEVKSQRGLLAPQATESITGLRSHLRRFGMHQDIPVIWIHSCIRNNGKRKVAGLSYLANNPAVAGARIVETGKKKTAPHYLDLRALRFALADYRGNPDTDLDKTVLVRVESNVVIDIISLAMKGCRPNITKKDVRLQHEFDRIIPLLNGMKIVAMKNSQFREACTNYRKEPQFSESLNMAVAAAEQFIRHRKVSDEKMAK